MFYQPDPDDSYYEAEAENLQNSKPKRKRPKEEKNEDELYED